MLNSVLAAATDLATMALAGGGGELAVWATNKALPLWPTDTGLASLALDASAASEQTSALSVTWNVITSNFANKEPLPDELTAHYHRLRNLQDRTAP